MANDSKTAEDFSDREVIITRLLNAPPELVFMVWTQPEHLAKWWGPDGFTTTVQSMDFRQGGTLRMTLHGMGVSFPNLIKYIEVVRPEKLVYLHGSGVEDDPGEFEVTVTFTDVGGKTRLTLRSLFKTAEARDFVIREFGAVERGNETVTHLEEYLAKIKDTANWVFN
ncbi:MAG TPA: SRPBCC domain-containing protein [Chitinophagaceae bacterium]|nr:SRPBCC domain-containing protein [Chitinophagaceae bacterium]